MDNETAYLIDTLPKREKWMLDLESYAKQNRVPIMEPISMNFLTQLVCIHKPESILEIGTAIGYSALRMHQVNPEARIVTIEKNEKMCHTARRNIKQLQKESQIEVISADALVHMQELVANEEKFDFIFIDAAKAQYKHFFILAEQLIHRHGMIVCDNVLFKGYVADEEKSDNPRLQKIANKISDFNKWLVEQEDYLTSIVPIGDGMTISIKH